MLNNAVYKSCLFLGAGNVEYRTNTTELDELGGLAKLMPITYISFMIASFSISGIPPFNGFVSKWMIYQGLVINIAESRGSIQSILSVFCLIAAMFGSALTLASFMKLLHAVFMGQRLDTAKSSQLKEVPRTMWWPCVILAAICVIFGIFAFILPLKYFIGPVIKEYLRLENYSLLGVWSPVPATLLMLLGLLAGFLIYKFGKFKLLLRRDSAFVGGEVQALQNENAVTGVDFYNSVQEIGVLRFFYKKAQDGVFDIYEQGKKVFMISRIFQLLHNGILPTYLVWVLLGAIGLFFALMR